MTFEQVLTFLTDPQIQRIVRNDGLTDFQKAANIHAIMIDPKAPPKPERKAPKLKPAPRDEASSSPIDEALS